MWIRHWRDLKFRGLEVFTIYKREHMEEIFDEKLEIQEKQRPLGLIR
jgi:hypothetical protein